MHSLCVFLDEGMRAREACVPGQLTDGNDLAPCTPTTGSSASGDGGLLSRRG